MSTPAPSWIDIGPLDAIPVRGADERVLAVIALIYLH